MSDSPRFIIEQRRSGGGEKPTLGHLTGVVEKIDYTSGGAGNQWTTIGGVRYATWWNISTKDWTCGDAVTFEAYERPLWHGQPPVLCAQSIHKAVAAEEAAS